MESRHDGMAMSCDISYDGKYMLSASDLDNAVLIWDLRQEKSIKIMKRKSPESLKVTQIFFKYYKSQLYK